MAAHHRRECAKVDPAVQQFVGPHITVQAGVAADIVMANQIAYQARGQSSREHGPDPVMAGKIDTLVACP